MFHFLIHTCHNGRPGIFGYIFIVSFSNEFANEKTFLDHKTFYLSHSTKNLNDFQLMKDHVEIPGFCCGH